LHLLFFSVHEIHVILLTTTSLLTQSAILLALYLIQFTYCYCRLRLIKV